MKHGRVTKSMRVEETLNDLVAKVEELFNKDVSIQELTKRRNRLIRKLKGIDAKIEERRRIIYMGLFKSKFQMIEEQVKK